MRKYRGIKLVTTNKKRNSLKSINIRIKQDSIVWVLASPKYGEKAKLCYMDTDRFIAPVKTDDIY